MNKKVVSKKVELPKYILKSDTVWPKYDAKTALTYKEYQELGLNLPELRLYNTTAMGWVVLVLQISGSGRRTGVGAERWYATRLDDGQLVSVGKGPHVLEEIHVYLTKANVNRLEPLIERYLKGSEEAGQYRDRLSSRRMQGRIRNAMRNSLWND